LLVYINQWTSVPQDWHGKSKKEEEPTSDIRDINILNFVFKSNAFRAIFVVCVVSGFL